VNMCRISVKICALCSTKSSTVFELCNLSRNGKICMTPTTEASKILTAVTRNPTNGVLSIDMSLLLEVNRDQIVCEGCNRTSVPSANPVTDRSIIAEQNVIVDIFKNVVGDTKWIDDMIPQGYDFTLVSSSLGMTLIRDLNKQTGIDLSVLLLVSKGGKLIPCTSEIMYTSSVLFGDGDPELVEEAVVDDVPDRHPAVAVRMVTTKRYGNMVSIIMPLVSASAVGGIPLIVSPTATKTIFTGSVSFVRLGLPMCNITPATTCVVSSQDPPTDTSKDLFTILTRNPSESESKSTFYRIRA